MNANRRPVVTHTFHGPRFDDHGVDVDVLQDLIRYKSLLVDVAKELWRRNHSDRKNLPKNFEDSLALKFYEVRPNCATIPLERELSHDERESLFVDDEFDDAALLVADTIEAAGLDRPLPEAFPKHFLAQLQEYGKSLRDDEWIEQRLSRRVSPVRHDSRVRQRLTRWIDGNYEDSVDVIGEVKMARVGKPRMAIELVDGREVESPFAADDEGTITTALQKHQTVRLQVIGRGLFSVDGALQRISEVSCIRILPAGHLPFDSTAKSIWDEFEEVLADVPAEEWEKVPRDASERLDFYLYGTGAEAK